MTPPVALAAVGWGDATYRRGTLLVAGATLAWSSAGLLQRWLSVDPWTTLFWRSVFALGFLCVWLAARRGRLALRGFRRLGVAGWAMAVCFAASMIFFINALTLTTVAAVLVFQAAAPLFAGAMAWAFLGERVGGLKLAAIVASLGGVLIMVSGAADSGSLAGVAMSAAMGLTFAATVVLARTRPDVPTTEASLLAVVLVALAAAPFARFAVAPDDMALLAGFGVGQMGLALVMFTTGVRLIPSADAGLVSVLESVLGPLWVWLMLGEDPGRATLAGGVIVITAVVVAARAGG